MNVYIELSAIVMALVAAVRCWCGRSIIVAIFLWHRLARGFFVRSGSCQAAKIDPIVRHRPSIERARPASNEH
jgi:hypothetical protein